jgi:microtubule-associated protein-like 6
LVSGKLVYAAAAVVVVHDPASNTQRFFSQHTDDVTALAMHPDGATAASGEMGKAPRVCVWDADRPQDCLARLEQGAGETVVAVAFTPDGNRLITVGVIGRYCMNVWDWRHGKKVSKGTMWNGTVPVGLFGVVPARETHKSGKAEFVVYDRKQLKWWVLARDELHHKAASFGGAHGPAEDILCCAFAAKATLLTGHPSGVVRVWRNRECLQRVGPIGSKVTSLSVLDLKLGLVLSGGVDGRVSTWRLDPATCQLTGIHVSTTGLDLEEGMPLPPVAAVAAVRAENGGRLYLGTKSAEIYEATCRGGEGGGWEDFQGVEGVRRVQAGHHGAVYMVAFHPTAPHMFATCGEGGKVLLWDANQRVCVDQVRVNEMFPERHEMFPE